MNPKLAALALAAAGSVHCASDSDGALGGAGAEAAGAAGREIVATAGAGAGGDPSAGFGGGTSAGQVGDDSAGGPDEPSLPLLDAPDTEQDLVAFLTAGSYASWQKEAEFHPSAGPHGNDVRVYYGPRAARALSDGSPTFPAGAAAIKELEGGGSVYGWSVWVKVVDASDDGNAFFWYERTQRADGTASVSGNGRGDRNCVGCHRAGKDFDLSTLPFE